MHTLVKLLDSIYPDLANLQDQSAEWVSERAIPTPGNDQASVISELLLNSFQGYEMVYDFIDSVMNPDDAIQYPAELLTLL